MKTKKAVKKLDKVVAILSDVIKQYAPTERQVRELLSAAKASVVRAKSAVTSPVSKTDTKASVTAKTVVASKAKQRGSKATAREKRPASAKKLRPPVRRKAVRAAKSPAATTEDWRTVEPAAEISPPTQEADHQEANSVSVTAEASEATSTA